MAKPILLKTLMDLLSIESFSNNEKPVIDYILPLLGNYGFTVGVDSIGNIYATRGKAASYPLLNAHMDSVKGFTTTYYNTRRVGKPKRCSGCDYGYKAGLVDICSITEKPTSLYEAVTCSDFDDTYTSVEEAIVVEPVVTPKVFALTYNEKTKEIKSNETRPMGGDDKCGIAIALEIARTTRIPMKIFFSVGEEIGLVGARHAIKNFDAFFIDCKYGITIDRKGGSDICVTTGGQRNASNYFIAELAKWAIITGFEPKFAAGSSSDNKLLKELVPNFINVSAGYYSPHTSREYVKYDEVKRIRTWIKNFILKGDIKL